MTSLTEHIAELIKATGPIPISHFMSLALGHPEHGYYRKQDPLGARGDFITAPEISQTFGELIGLWAIDLWQRSGRPDPVDIVELGPGRGTLMADLARIAKVAPDFQAAMRIHFVETSPTLRAEQAARVPGAAWHDSLASLPHGPALIIANEFFDALPIRQFERTAKGWCERHVTLDAGSGSTFALCLAPDPVPLSILPAYAAQAPVGAICEICPAGQTIAGEIGERIAHHGIAALIVDYGTSMTAPGDTLQAASRHRYANVWQDPGEVDITAHVDFETLSTAIALEGASVWGPIGQGEFLISLGIQTRTQRLAEAAATAAQKEDILSGVERLIAPDQMGTLFKVLAVTKSGSPMPAGFQQ